MTKANALKRLHQVCDPDTVKTDSDRYRCGNREGLPPMEPGDWMEAWGQIGRYVVSCQANAGSDEPILHGHYRRGNDHDDSQTDYYAGSYTDTLGGAISAAHRCQERDARDAAMPPVMPAYPALRIA